MSPVTDCQWGSNFGGMVKSDMRRVRELENVNAKPKRMYADLALDNKRGAGLAIVFLE
jgi:putative transposase